MKAPKVTPQLVRELLAVSTAVLVSDEDGTTVEVLPALSDELAGDAAVIVWAEHEDASAPFLRELEAGTRRDWCESRAARVLADHLRETAAHL